MGSLTPGATYNYEYEDGVVYATELGTGERKIIGYNHDSFTDTVILEYELETVWKEIIKESQTNITLQKALERVKILYHLSKDNGKK
jgi:hypothetical protein